MHFADLSPSNTETVQLIVLGCLGLLLCLGAYLALKLKV